MVRKEIYLQIKNFVRFHTTKLGKNKFSKLCKMGWGKIEIMIRTRGGGYSDDDLIDIFEIMKYEFYKNLQFENDNIKLQVVKW